MTSPVLPPRNQISMNGGAGQILQQNPLANAIGGGYVGSTRNYETTTTSTYPGTAQRVVYDTSASNGQARYEKYNVAAEAPVFGDVAARQANLYTTSSTNIQSEQPLTYATTGATQTKYASNTIYQQQQQQQEQRVISTADDQGFNARLVPLSTIQHYKEHQQTTGSSVAGRSEASSVVRREVGEQRLISTTERVDESRSRIVNESEVVRTIMVPKKIIHEDVIEKTIIVPETIRREEIIDEQHTIKEKIIEMTKPIIVHKVIEVPEIEYVEQAPVREVKVVERVVKQDKTVPVKKYQYVELPREEVENIIYVGQEPEIEYVEVPNPVPFDVHRNLPIPVQSEVTYEFKKPNFKPVHEKINFQVHIPRFVEVPVVAELLTPQQRKIALDQIAEVQSLTTMAASLCEIEATAARVMEIDLPGQVQKVDLKNSLVEAWRSDKLGVAA